MAKAGSSETRRGRVVARQALLVPGSAPDLPDIRRATIALPVGGRGVGPCVNRIKLELFIELHWEG